MPSPYFFIILIAANPMAAEVFLAIGSDNILL